MAVMRGDERVEPVFRLLGEGLLTPAEVDRLTASLVAAGLPAVPEAWLARARLIAQGGARRDRAWGRARAPRLLPATLMAEQRPWLAAVGVRGSGAGIAGICRLRFAVDAYEIVIQGTSRRHQRGHDLTGQALRDGEPVSGVGIVLTGEAQQAETEADDDGSFRFWGVPAGSYDLEVWADDDLIVCSPLVLSEL